MRRYSLSEAMQIDQHIMQLAFYETTQGMLLNINSMEEVMKLQDKVKDNFNYFKKMIQQSECTMDELEQLVVKRHGPVVNEDKNLSIDESLDKIVNSPSTSNDPIQDDMGTELMKIMIGAIGKELMDQPLDPMKQNKKPYFEVMPLDSNDYKKDNGKESETTDSKSDKQSSDSEKTRKKRKPTNNDEKDV